MRKKIISAVTAAAMLTGITASAANAAVRPASAVPVTAASTTVVQGYEEDANFLGPILFLGVAAAAIALLVLLEDDEEVVIDPISFG